MLRQASWRRGAGGRCGSLAEARKKERADWCAASRRRRRLCASGRGLPVTDLVRMQWRLERSPTRPHISQCRPASVAVARRQWRWAAMGARRGHAVPAGVTASAQAAAAAGSSTGHAVSAGVTGCLFGLSRRARASSLSQDTRVLTHTVAQLPFRLSRRTRASSLTP